MKKSSRFLLLLICFAAISSMSFINSVPITKIVGFWKSDSNSVRLLFFVDINQKLQLVSWDNAADELVIESLKIEDDVVKTIEYFPSTDYRTTNIYALEDQNMIKNTVMVKDQNKRDSVIDTIIYYRKK